MLNKSQRPEQTSVSVCARAYPHIYAPNNEVNERKEIQENILYCISVLLLIIITMFISFCMSIEYKIHSTLFIFIISFSIVMFCCCVFFFIATLVLFFVYVWVLLLSGYLVHHTIKCNCIVSFRFHFWLFLLTGSRLSTKKKVIQT